MDLVEDFLVVGVGVDGGHQPTLDPHQIVHDHRNRGKAIGGAGRIRHDHMIAAELLVVDAVDDGQIDALAGCGNQHPPGAGFDMGAGLGSVGEEAGAFQRDINAKFLVGQLARVALCGHADALAVDDEIGAISLHIAGEAAMHGVTLEQQCIHFCVAKIVDRDDFDVGAALLKDGAKHQAADAPETVDGNLHVSALLVLF